MLVDGKLILSIYIIYIEFLNGSLCPPLVIICPPIRSVLTLNISLHTNVGPHTHTHTHSNRQNPLQACMMLECVAADVRPTFTWRNTQQTHSCPLPRRLTPQRKMSSPPWNSSTASPTHSWQLSWRSQSMQHPITSYKVAQTLTYTNTASINSGLMKKPVVFK